MRCSNKLYDILVAWGVSQDVINYITSAGKDMITPLVSIVKQNTSITLEQLQNKYIPPRHFVMPEDYEWIPKLYSEYPSYQKWVEKQIRKAVNSNHKNLHLNSDPFCTILKWYVASLRDNKNFNIHSYDFARAISLAHEWYAVTIGEGNGELYTPIERDEYGNIIDQRVVYKWDDGWYIIALDNKNDFVVESEKMNHCVKIYWDDYTHGKTIILSLRNPNNTPQATIQLNNRNEIIQVGGNSNTQLPVKLKQKVVEWYNHFNIRDASNI